MIKLESMVTAAGTALEGADAFFALARIVAGLAFAAGFVLARIVVSRFAVFSVSLAY
jgi:hypothetical protein